jgi:hypothetical protein
LGKTIKKYKAQIAGNIIVNLGKEVYGCCVNWANVSGFIISGRLLVLQEAGTLC